MNEIQALIEKHPLLGFSADTHTQIEVLKDLGSSIRALLDESVSEGQVQALGLKRVYGEFWLWILGVYEVVRAMDQAKGCFSNRAAADIHAFKKRVAELRMPFAKQEYAGSRSGGIAGEASIAGIDSSSRDFTYEVRGETFSVRGLLVDFEALMNGISRADVLKDQRESY